MGYDYRVIKKSTFRRGRYNNGYAPYGVKVFSYTGSKEFFFTRQDARANFIRMAKRKRNYRFHRSFYVSGSR
jgi:hypothetical protein